MTPLTDLTWQERQYEVAAALAAVVLELPAVAPTTVVVARVCRRLETDRTDMVAKEVLRLAPKHAHATRNGEVKMRFGRRVTGWLWHSTPQTEVIARAPGASAEAIAAREAALYEPDPTQWDDV